MTKREKTSQRVARQAAGALRNPETPARAKSVAGSALAQTKARKETSPRVASRAGQLLGDGRTSSVAKTLAASALTQKPAASKKAPNAKKVGMKITLTFPKTEKAGSNVSQRKAVSKRSGRALPAATGKSKKPAKSTSKVTLKFKGEKAGVALTQHVTTRRNAEGKSVRVVLTPYRGGALRRDRVEAVVLDVLRSKKK
jgi:hypothetical protein